MLYIFSAKSILFSLYKSAQARYNKRNRNYFENIVCSTVSEHLFVCLQKFKMFTFRT